MFTLRQSAHIKGSAGNPLPKVFDSLDKKGTVFRRGQLALVCAGPGVGKSGLVLTYALKSKVPTLYLSADSDSFTQLSRAISILTGCTLEESAKSVLSDDLGDAAEQLESIPIRFNYKASPSLSELYDTLSAYDALYEDYPALIVVDNITNVRSELADDDDPFSGLESLMDRLHEMARETGACVVGLHHVTGGYNDADKPIPLSGVKGQISRVPELILTLHRVPAEFGNDALNVSTVKNRSGASDPSGKDFVTLSFDGERMTIRDQA